MASSAFQEMMNLVESVGSPTTYDVESNTIKFNNDWDAYVNFSEKMKENNFLFNEVKVDPFVNLLLLCWKNSNPNDSFLINVEPCKHPSIDLN